MSEVKRLVCLANSRKLSGRCLAGKETGGSGTWVRPVSDRLHQEVSEHERQYEDGSDPKVLDIIDVPLLHSQPNAYQSENWLLDPQFYWAKVGRVDWESLSTFADQPRELWLNGFSTGSGLNDRVPVKEAQQLGESLFLLRVHNLTLHVFAPGAAFNNLKRRVQADFSFQGVQYLLWVTDPLIERQYAGNDGDYDVGECFLTVSLGEPKDNFCYKLVAAIITPRS
jgi:hypothetical protein